MSTPTEADALIAYIGQVKQSLTPAQKQQLQQNLANRLARLTNAVVGVQKALDELK
jgi:Spy/CpxP family protein refolding chaperone